MDDRSNQFRVYEDFPPSTDFYEVEQTYVLLLNLPGFKKEHMRVQLNSLGTLIIRGERPLPDNKWRRFTKEFPTPPDCDVTQIRAKLENDILKVIMPKTETTTPTAPKPPPPPTTEPSRTSRPSSVVAPPPSQKPATEWKSLEPTTPLPPPPPLPQATSVPEPSKKPAKEPILPTPKKTPTQPQQGKPSHQMEAKTDEGRHEDDESTTSTDDDYTTTSSDDDKDEKKLVGDAEKQMKKDNGAEKNTKSKSSPPPLPQQKATSVPKPSRKTATEPILPTPKTPSEPTKPSHHLKARTDEGRREDDEFTTTSSDSDQDEKPLKGVDKLMKKDNGAQKSRKTKIDAYKNKIKGFTMELKEKPLLSSNETQLVVKIAVGGLALVSLLVYIAWNLKSSQEN